MLGVEYSWCPMRLGVSFHVGIFLRHVFTDEVMLLAYSISKSVRFSRFTRALSLDEFVLARIGSISVPPTHPMFLLPSE